MTQPPSSRLQSIRDLHPAYFACVMSTGIVAIACNLEGLVLPARVLAALGMVMFVVLGILILLRAGLFPRAFHRDLRDHERGVGFFTIIAGTAVLGSCTLSIFGLYRLPLLLWFASVILWVLATYVIFAGFILKRGKPSLRQGIHGSWLLAVVATESVAQLALHLLPNFPNYLTPVLFLSLALWLSGGMLYIWMISLIFYRYMFFAVLPSDLLPFYWIDMGAMAIASVVGALLVEKTTRSPLSDLLPFVKGFAILFWATATWWIPMLAIFAVWRHTVARQSFAYSPVYWGAVFPLGMYAVATGRLMQITGFAFLRWIPKVFTWAALAAWLATFAGLLGTFRVSHAGRTGAAETNET